MKVRAWQGKLILVAMCVLVGARAASASPEGPQTESPPQSALPLNDPFSSARTVNWKSFAPNVLHDQKSIWTFPAQLAHGEHWKPALGITAAVGALVALDAYDTPYFGRTSAFSGFNRGLSGRNTALAFSLFPVSIYALGQVRKDSYATQTSLLSAEALVDSEVLAWVFKTADERRRPAAIPLGGNYSDSWFESYRSPLAGNGSFPSGHTIAAFSVATVFARRYRSHRWVPWVAYGAAGLIGFSRITLQAHFPSDVFAGAAFGYVISRYAVLRGH